MKNKIDWIAVDWGTSSLRAWAMDAEGQDLDRNSSDQGMGKLTPIEFEPTLIALITCLLYTSPSPRDVEESRMPSSA